MKTTRIIPAQSRQGNNLEKHSLPTMICIAFLFCIAAVIACPAQQISLQTLADFNLTNGAEPLYVSLVQGNDGNFYGTTALGGNPCQYGAGCGTVFKMTPAGSLTTYEFGSDSGDGSYPASGLAQGSDGNFYGTTVYGGDFVDCGFGCGTVFQFNPSSGALTTLHQFNGPDYGAGAQPVAMLVEGRDGYFYGTTQSGGISCNGVGCGTVFKIDPNPPYYTLTTLHRFCSQPNCADGTGPGGLVLGSDGNFYGTTGGGGANNYGTVFKINPSPPYTLTTLYSFCSQSNCADGSNPFALVQGSDGNFYGATSQHGANGDGTVFKITPSGTLTTLHSFNGTDGECPIAALAQGSDGNFYGTTPEGGSGGYGTVFKITPSGTLTTLHNFEGYPTDGATAYGGLVQAADGSFYGATAGGGTNNDGTVYRLSGAISPPPLASFNGTNGAHPGNEALAQGADGNFYGTTVGGGTSGRGTVFQVTQTGVLNSIYNFCSQPNCNDGYLSIGGLLLGSDGDFYGTTFGGGATGEGTVFKITPSGTLTTLYSFCTQTGCTDGTNPFAGLAQDSQGNFYGTTNQAGTMGRGTFFQLTQLGAYNVLYNFCSQASCADGGNPLGNLVRDSQGNFYGTTSTGGSGRNCSSAVAGCGTIFKITNGPPYTLTTLHSFCSQPGCPDGYTFYGGLVLGSDGNLYGTTSEGANGYGTVYKITPTSYEFTLLYTFCSQPNCTDGAWPYAPLVLGSDGNFYGTTAGGGNYWLNGGTFFRITPSGTLTTLHSFCSQQYCPDGGAPEGGLLQAPSGIFFGTTYEGGAYGYGTVFSLRASPPIGPNPILR